MTKVKKPKNEFYYYGEPAAFILSRLESDLEANKISQPEALLEAIMVLEKVVLFSDMRVENKPIQIDWLYDLAAKLLNAKMDKLTDSIYIGWLVHGLIVCGSSRIQAIQAIAEWQIISETKVRDAHSLLKKHGRTKGADTPDKLVFLLNQTEDINLNWVFENTLKPFPKDFPKAAQAFILLRQAFAKSPRSL